MKKDIYTFVVECDNFQRHKLETMAPLGELQPLPILTIVWTNISMDFNAGLPKSGNKFVIMVVVDLLSKYTYFCFYNTFSRTLWDQVLNDG